MVIFMTFMNQAFGEFHKFSNNMTTSLRFCLSYEPLKWDFMTFITNIISMSKCIGETDVVNGVTCTHQSVFTHVVIRVF